MALGKTPLRVLLVEDNASVRTFIAEALHSVARVAEAGDASQALSFLANQAARGLDLVIVDCLLPEPGAPPHGAVTPAGVELVRVIRARWPWLTVVAITGALDAETLLREARRFGAADVLRKPFGVGELSDLLGRLPVRRVPATRGGGDVAMKRVIGFIGEHYTESLGLRDLAGMAAMSRSHFCRMFRAATGVAFRDYVRTLRLRRAEEMLRRPRASFTAIALEVGFYDLAHFDKAFRKRFGVSPSEFVRRGPAPAGTRAANGQRQRPAAGGA